MTDEIEDIDTKPSKRDLVTAILAVERGLATGEILKLPPTLAVELPNIRRILLHYAELRAPDPSFR